MGRPPAPIPYRPCMYCGGDPDLHGDEVSYCLDCLKEVLYGEIPRPSVITGKMPHLPRGVRIFSVNGVDRRPRRESGQ